MTETASLFIDCRCELGEGPIWHPILERLFWFDILNNTLFSATDQGQLVDRFIFEAPVSAAAIVDRDRLLIAGAANLTMLDVTTDMREAVLPLEADRPGNRSNDSRVHPSGAFWISTMGRNGDKDVGAGSIYHFAKGTLTRLFDGLTIPNAVCFAPDGRTAYFADTPTGRILKCATDPSSGMPSGEPELFVALGAGEGAPDGAVVDAEGFLWNARWGGSAVARYAPDGTLDRLVTIPTSNVTCPAFGGKDRKTLFVTTAREHKTPEELLADPMAGSIFSIAVDVPGQAETPVRL